LNLNGIFLFFMHTVYNAELLFVIDCLIFRLSPEMVLTLHIDPIPENLIVGFDYDLHYTSDYELVFYRLSPKQV
jgi:hypothetical protein